MSQETEKYNFFKFPKNIGIHCQHCYEKLYLRLTVAFFDRDADRVNRPLGVEFVDIIDKNVDRDPEKVEKVKGVGS